MRYVSLTWPEIQDYMNHPGYPEECFYDPNKDIYIIPEEWLLDERTWKYCGTDWQEDPDGIGDLEDAMG